MMTVWCSPGTAIVTFPLEFYKWGQEAQVIFHLSHHIIHMREYNNTTIQYATLSHTGHSCHSHISKHYTLTV